MESKIFKFIIYIREGRKGLSFVLKETLNIHIVKVCWSYVASNINDSLTIIDLLSISGMIWGYTKVFHNIISWYFHNLHSKQRKIIKININIATWDSSTFRGLLKCCSHGHFTTMVIPFNINKQKNQIQFKPLWFKFSYWLLSSTLTKARRSNGRQTSSKFPKTFVLLCSKVLLKIF